MVLIHLVFRVDQFWRSWSEDFLKAWRMTDKFIHSGSYRPIIALIIVFHVMFVAWMVSSNIYWFLRDAVISLFR